MSASRAHRAGRVFVGRQGELDLLRSLLEETRTGEPRFVLLEGPPGIGKSALVEHFLAGTVDVRVLRASGAREENLLPYGVADQLARSARLPLGEPFTGLGASGERSPEPFVVGAALLDLLGTLQQHGPVVVVLDDAQWADRPSLLALLFALRRLLVDRVLTVLAVRDERSEELPEGLLRIFEGTQGARLRLGGLDAGEVVELGSEILPEELPADVARRLHEHTGGSPLHVRALLEELPFDRLRAGAWEPLPSPRSFAIQVQSRLAGCPDSARDLVAACSVLGLQCPLGLAGRLAGIDDALAALEGAISARLLQERAVDGGPGVAFPHALVRAAVYHDLGAARRSALHLRAAQLVADPAASIQHRVAAAPGEDAELAAELADFSRREAERGAQSRAAAGLLAAARLSPPGPGRDGLLLEGADRLLDQGEVARAALITAEVGEEDTALRRHVRGRLAFTSGRLADAEELLTGAWERSSVAGDRLLAARTAMQMEFLLARRSRGDECLTWARRAMEAAAATPLSRAPMSQLAQGLAFSGHAEEGLAEVGRLADPPQCSDADDVSAVWARGLLRLVTDDLEGARRDFAAAAPAAARLGLIVWRLGSLTYLSVTENRLGAWDDAIVHAELACSLGQDTDQLWMLGMFHAEATAPLAARGDWEAARAHAAAAGTYRAGGAEGAVADAALAPAHVAMATGDPAGVVAALEPIVNLPVRGAIDEPGTRWSTWREMYADALVALRRFEPAEEVLVALEERAALRRRRSAMVSAARVRGNLEGARGRTAEADAAFTAGLEHAEAVPIPFDRARLELAYGGFLRRHGRRAPAMAQLQAASERFSALGARPYLDRCSRELAACGLTLPGRRNPDRTRLTPQELSVARLVVSGMGNRQVATELSVSINTVEFHLKNVYSKLGVRSREELAVEMGKS